MGDLVEIYVGGRQKLKIDLKGQVKMSGEV